jgi:PTH1 family peptidyl-tRNA hydrolase
VPAIKLIVGLGNPGTEYEPTRHNAGFWFVDDLAGRCQQSFRNEVRFHGQAARCLLDGSDCRLLKPMTYMNRSGQAVRAMVQFFKVSLEEILVVHDELDLPAGTVKLKKGGGHGGHNGLRDLISQLGDREFYRLRVGIGHPGNKNQVVDYVLKKPSREDRALIEDAIYAAMDVMPLLVKGQFDKAMHLLHSRNG